MHHPWRSDPQLASLFGIDRPDDLQVLLHDGEPRRTGRKPEPGWVTVTALHATLRFPIALADRIPQTVEGAQWQERAVYAASPGGVLFMYVPGLSHPLQVQPAYLAERPDWALVPCNRCGADQGFDPPTVMARTRFPLADPEAVVESFSAFCTCGGFMLLSKLARDPDSAFAPEMPPKPASKPWWRFW